MRALFKYAVAPFSRQTVLVAALFFFLFGRVVGQEEKQGECGLTYEIVTYESSGKQIQIEKYQPKAKAKLPILIFVHGAGGVFSRKAGTSEVPTIDNFGEKHFACGGFIVLVPHYLESTGQASAIKSEEIEANAPIWMRAVADAVGYAGRLRADNKGIFLFGESLGGYLAIGVAHDQRIRGVSTFGAGLPHGIEIGRMPPILIQHGELDDIVPVSEAVKLESKLRAMGCSVTLRIFPGLGHYAADEARAEIVRATIRFFQSAR